MSGIIVGSVGVEIVPNVERFTERLRAALAPVTDRVTAAVRIDADTAAATAHVDALQGRLDRLGLGKTVDIRVDAAGALRDLEALRVELARLDGGGGGAGKKGGAGAGAGLGVAAGAGVGLAAIGPALGGAGLAAVGGLGVVGGLAAGFAAASVGAAVFAGVAKTSIGAVTAAQAALNKAQAQYANATTVKQQQAALAAEAAATSNLTDGQLQLLAAVQATSASYAAVQAGVEPLVTPVLIQGLRDLGPLIAALGPITASVAPAFLGLANDLARASSGPEFGQFVAFVESTAPTAITDLGRFAGDIGLTVSHVLQALAPLTSGVLGDLDHLGQKLASTNLGPGSEFGRFVAESQKDLPLLGHDLGELAGVIASLVADVLPLGHPLLVLIDGLAQVLVSVEPLVSLLARGLNPALNALGTAVKFAAPELGPLALGLAAVYAVNRGNNLSKDTQAIVGAIGKIGPAAEGAAASTGRFSAVLGRIGPAVAPALPALAFLGIGVATLLSATAAADAKLRSLTDAITTAVPLNSLAGLDAADQKLADLSAHLPVLAALFGGGSQSVTAAFEQTSLKAGALAQNLTILSEVTGRTKGAVLALANTTGVDLTDSTAAANHNLELFSQIAAIQGTAVLPGLNHAYEDFHNTVGDVGRSVSGLNEFFASLNTTLGQTTTEDTFTTALRGTKLALDATSLSITSQTSDAISNRQALTGLITQIQEHAAAEVKAHLPNAQIEKDYLKNYKAVLDLAGGNATARANLNALLTRMGASPAEFNKFVGGVTSTFGPLANLQSYLQAIANHDYFGQIIAQIQQLANNLPLLNAFGQAASGGAPSGGLPGVLLSTLPQPAYRTPPQARAGGGPVYPGGDYIVGEHGPEWFVPRTAGTIVPNNAMGFGADDTTALLRAQNALLTRQNALLAAAPAATGAAVAGGINAHASTGYIQARGGRH